MANQPIKEQKNEWLNEGTSCCSPVESCCLAYWCPCVMYGKVAHRVYNNDNMDGYSACNLNCCAWYCLASICFAWVIEMGTRGSLRDKYNLKGTGCTDCLCAGCCSCCDLVQMDKEIDSQKQKLLPTVTSQPEKAHDSMVYAAAPQQQFHQTPHAQSSQPPQQHQQFQQYQNQHHP